MTQRNLRPIRKKLFSLETKKVICVQNFRKNDYFSKKKNNGTDGIDGVRRDRDEGDKKPFALCSPQAREGFLAEKRHVQQHRRHDTGELPNAHAHPGIEHCREECCQKRHCGVHDGIGHAKPPQLSVGIHHDGRHCQCAEVIQSLFLPFREKNSHWSDPHAIKSGRFTWCSWSTRKNSWSGPLQPRKTAQ